MRTLMRKAVRTNEIQRGRLRRTSTVRAMHDVGEITSWRKSHRMDGKRSSFSMFMMRLALLTVIALIVTATYHLALSHPFVNVRVIEVAGNNALSREAVTDSLSGLVGVNIFSAPVDQATDELMKNPWIKGAHIGRKLPATLKVEVMEHIPAAEIVSLGRTYLVDREGIILEEVARKRWNSLPLIIGFDKTLKPGEILESLAFEDAFYLKRLFEMDQDFSDKVSYIDVSNPDRIRISLVSGVEVLLGSVREEWHRKFIEYVAVRKILEERGERAASMDLSFRQQVVVRKEGILSGSVTEFTGNNARMRTDRSANL